MLMEIDSNDFTIKVDYESGTRDLVLSTTYYSTSARKSTDDVHVALILHAENHHCARVVVATRGIPPISSQYRYRSKPITTRMSNVMDVAFISTSS